MKALPRKDDMSDKEGRDKGKPKSTRQSLVLDTAFIDGDDDFILGLPSTYDLQLWMNERPFYTKTLESVDYTNGDEKLMGIGWITTFKDDFVELIDKYRDPSNKHSALEFVDRLGLDQQVIDFLVYWRDYSRATFLTFKELPKAK